MAACPARRSPWAAAVLAVVAVGCPATGENAGGRDAAPAGSTGEDRTVASPELPPAPHRVRRDAVPVVIDGAPAGAEWVMHESAPLVEPDAEARPVTVLLHAICADDGWTCDWLQYFPMAPQWQLCPRAPVACSGGGWQWTASGATELRVVAQAVATAKARHEGRVRDDAVVLAGFSQGAYAVAAVVRELARQPAPALHVKGVLVQGGRVHFEPGDAKHLGLRVALTAGERDPAAAAMRVEAMDLQRAGVDARYVSLGKDEGHYVPVGAGQTIAQLVDWCRGE